MVNLHLKQRALERLRYRPEPHWFSGTCTYPHHAFEPARAPARVWLALQGSVDQEDVPNPSVEAPAFDQPIHIFIDNSKQRRRAQAKIVWIVFLVGVFVLAVIFCDKHLSRWRKEPDEWPGYSP